MYFSRVLLFSVGVTLVSSIKNLGLPGLVFDDFDQLYSKILYTDLLDQETMEGPKYEFKLPEVEQLLQGKNKDLLDPNNKTSALFEYINDIDYKTIVAIQKLTADVYEHESKARDEIQKYSNAFRRDAKCMKEIKENYRNVLQIKVKETPKTSCTDRLQGQLNNFDPAFEVLVASCLELQPLNVKQKFMRIYAEIYIALEKTSECSTKTNIYECAQKIMKSDLSPQLEKIKQLPDRFKEKIDKFQRLAPKCCSFLKHYLKNTNKNSFC